MTIPNKHATRQAWAAMAAAADSGEYLIDVGATADTQLGVLLARVVVRHLPDLREVFRSEFPAGRLSTTRRHDALAAALARGQEAVREEQCRLGQELR